jgi:hypothetical protein
MLTLAITAYNEHEREDGEWLMRAIAPAELCSEVTEIVVIDDASDQPDFVSNLCRGRPKVTVHRNGKNLGVFGSKVMSVAMSSNPWVVMCDSDNVFWMDTYRQMRTVSLHPDVLYSPCYGMWQLDYRKFCGLGPYDATKFVSLAGRDGFACLFNTGNQVVNRFTFLQVFGGFSKGRFDFNQPRYFPEQEHNAQDPKWRVIYDAADSAFINKTWLLSGRRISVASWLMYIHTMSLDRCSFNKAPALKRALPPIYLEELRAFAEGKCDPRCRYVEEIQPSDKDPNSTLVLKLEVDGTLWAIQGHNYQIRDVFKC